MRKVYFAVLLILAGVLLSACKKTEICETGFYEQDIVRPMVDGIGVNGRIEPFSSGLCVITTEDIYDPGLLDLPVAMLLSEDTGEVLYSKGALQKIWPASMTKCMTALLVIEHFQDLDTLITAGDEVYEGIPENSSLAGLEPGMTLSVRDLLTGLILPSGNDAANVLAKAVSGSIPEFVSLMNHRAEELGMINTHFANPNGIHDEKHYTTAYDLYLLMRALMQYEAFTAPASASEGYMTAILPDGTEKTISYKSTNSYARGFTVPPEGIKYLYSKTGYTEQAGRCIIGVFSDRGGNRYIAVSARADNYDKLYLQTNAMLTIIGQQ